MSQARIVPSRAAEMRDTMPKITVTGQDGTTHSLEAKEGAALMEPLRDAELVEATCGGAASCGTCHVFIADKWLASTGERTEEEGWMLEALEDEVEIKECSRLACQVALGSEHDGIEVTIAPQV